MVREIQPRDLAAKLAAGEPVYLVDVRKPWEHDLVALPGSLLLPLDQLPRRTAEVRPPPGALVVTYCHHGVRSLNAAAFLGRLGHEAVASLAGGIEAWACEVEPGMQRY